MNTSFPLGGSRPPTPAVTGEEITSRSSSPTSESGKDRRPEDGTISNIVSNTFQSIDRDSETNFSADLAKQGLTELKCDTLEQETFQGPVSQEDLCTKLNLSYQELKSEHRGIGTEARDKALGGFQAYLETIQDEFEGVEGFKELKAQVEADISHTKDTVEEGYVSQLRQVFEDLKSGQSDALEGFLTQLESLGEELEGVEGFKELKADVEATVKVSELPSTETKGDLCKSRFEEAQKEANKEVQLDNGHTIIVGDRFWVDLTRTHFEAKGNDLPPGEPEPKLNTMVKQLGKETVENCNFILNQTLPNQLLAQLRGTLKQPTDHIERIVPSPLPLLTINTLDNGMVQVVAHVITKEIDMADFHNPDVQDRTPKVKGFKAMSYEVVLDPNDPENSTKTKEKIIDHGYFKLDQPYDTVSNNEQGLKYPTPFDQPVIEAFAEKMKKSVE